MLHRTQRMGMTLLEKGVLRHSPWVLRSSFFFVDSHFISLKIMFFLSSFVRACVCVCLCVWYAQAKCIALCRLLRCTFSIINVQHLLQCAKWCDGFRALQTKTQQQQHLYDKSPRHLISLILIEFLSNRHKCHKSHWPFIILQSDERKLLTFLVSFFEIWFEIKSSLRSAISTPSSVLLQLSKLQAERSFIWEK